LNKPIEGCTCVSNIHQYIYVYAELERVHTDQKAHTEN